jgi:integrase
LGRVYIEAKNAMAKRKLWIESFPSGLKWINALPSKNTKIQYATYLKLYCDAVQKNPEELIALKIEGLKHTGDTEEFQAEDLLENFFSKAKLQPSARLSLRNAVFSFYKWNRRALEKTTASCVKNSLPQAKTRNPTLEDIQALEDNVSTHRDGAIIRFISSTALRVGSLSKLTWSDLKTTGNIEAPFMLEVEAGRLKGSGFGKYKGIKHICFVNKWAVEKLEEYKKEAVLKGYVIKETDPIFIRYYQKDRNQNEGLTTKGFFQLFDSASLRAWRDLEVKKFSPHDLRSFVQSALESANIHPNIISPLLGHKVKGIDSSYSQHNIEELLESYVSALPYLVPKTVSALETELKTTESKFKTQQQQIEELQNLVKKYFHDEDILRNNASTKHGKEWFEEIAEAHKEQPKVLKELKEKAQKGTE